MYTFKDKELTEEQIAKFAEEKGVDVATFLANNPEIKGKKQPTTQEDAEIVDVTEASQKNTDSPSEDGSLGLEETKYKTPLTLEEKKSLQNNKFAKQMSKEDNFTKERLIELKQVDKDPYDILKDIKSIDEEIELIAGEDMLVDPLDSPKRIKQYNELASKRNSKLKEAKNKISDRGTFSSIYQAFKQGDSNLGEMLLSVPSFFYEVGALFSDPINRALGLPETDLKKFEESIGTRPLLDELIAEQENLSKQREIYKDIKNIKGDAYSNLSKGNFEDGFYLLGESLAESAPVSISLMMGGVAGLSRTALTLGGGVPLAAGELRTQQEEYPDQSREETLLKSSLIGMSEGFFEGILGAGALGGVYKNIIKKQGLEQGKKTFKDGLVTMYQAALEKYGIPVALAGNGFEEAATQATQNIVNGKPINEGVANAFTVGLGSGGVYGAPVNISKGVRYGQETLQKVNVNKLIKKTKYTSVSEAFNPEIKTEETQIKLSQNPNSIKVLDQQLKNQVSKGEKTQEEADAVALNFRQTQGTVNSIKPLRLSDSDQATTVELLKEKKQLTEEIKQVGEPSLTTEQSNRIKEIDNDLKGIGSKAVTQEVEKVKKAAEGIKDLDVQEFASTEETEAFLNEQRQDPKASGQQGFIIQDPKTGKQTIVINREIADKEIAVAAPSHEFLHALLFQTVKDSPETQLALGNSLKEYINKIDAAKVKDSNFARRLEQYKSDPEAVQAEEVLTLFSDAIRTEDIKFNETVFTKIGDVVRKALQALGVKVKFNNGKDVYNFIKDYNKSLESTGLTKAQIKAAEGITGKLVADKVKTDEQTIKESRIVSPQATALKDVLSNEELVESIKSPTTEDKFSVAQAIVEKNWPVISKQIDFTPAQQDTAKEVVEEQILGVFQGSGQGKYSPRNTGLFNAFDPSVAQVNTYLGKTIASRKPEIDLAIKERAGVTGQDLSKAEGVTVTESTPAQVDTKRIKPSSLLPSDVVSKVKKEVKEKLKDVPTDKLTFKKLGNLAPEIIAEAIGIPVKKLTDATANLSKSDASAIQRFISQKPETLIKLLPEGAVLEAATQKLMGTSTGVPKSLLDAFYTKQDRTTDPSGLYPFKLNSNLNRANFLEAFGIVDGKKAKDFSPRSAEAQRLKGIASLFGRLVTNEIARTEGDLSLETAKDVAAGKSRLMFSKAVETALDRPLFELEEKVVDELLEKYNQQKTFKYKTKEQVDEAIKEIEKELLPLMPRDFWFGKPDSKGNYGTAFTPSSKVFGTTEKAKDLYKNYWTTEIKKLRNLPDSAFGKKIPGINDFSKSSYSTIFKNEVTIKKNIENGNIDRFNDKVSKIHEALWKRIYDKIQNNPKSATIIANYLKMVGSDTSHWHKLGAKFVGYSKNPSGRYEYEHAMPATAAYLYLLDASLSGANFNAAYAAVMDNYKLIALDKVMDKKLTAVGLQRKMPKGWKLLENFWWQRYFNEEVAAIDGGIPTNSLIFLNGKDAAQELKVDSAGNATTPAIQKSSIKASKFNNDKSAFKFSKTPTNKVTIETAATTDKALNIARDLNAPVKKIRVFDFDDTLAQTKSDVLYTMPDGTEGKLNAEQFASDGSTLLSEGAVFDFSEFNKVTEGKKGPLFKVAQTIAAKRGTEDVFVLTARAPESQLAIYEFLKSQGLDIPLKNITGLGNSTGEAKARWIVGKAADGYNDFYFADDAPQNVKAVKDALSVLDVKSKTQQAKIKFSKSLDLNKDFNDIIENKTGIASDKTYARVKAEVAGANKGRFNFFIPPSAEDFVGLLYSTLGKGDVGTAQMAWYKAHLLNPFARAMENLANDRVSMMQDYRGLKKALKIVPKDLRKKIKDSNFTKEQAVRVAIWDKQGMSVPGLSQKDQKELVDYVNADAELTVFAEQLVDINKGDEYASPDAGWVAGTIDTDFIKALNTTKRSKYLETWQQNADIIFSEANLNKLEAAYGKPYRVALENMLHRMKTGRNRSFGTDTITSRFTDWLTNSVGAIMFFNTRSAVLQTISSVNFINFTDNNVLKAGQAFANQPQYWSDFKKLFNSPFLLDRRSGIKLNVNEADIAEMAKGPGNSARNVVAGLLKLGFLPTQIADSFAIASGGATFYRNRIKALKKEGLTEAEAEEIAFRDFREIAEESQQSSRPDKISQQQAGPLGRIVLAFANTPAQYARLIKKAASDLKNGRGDAKTNISKIIYYGVAQNLLFSALQQALFAIGFGDEDEEEEKRNEKYFNIANGMADSILRGIGVGGAVVSVVKNTAIRLAKEADKKAPKYQDAVVKGVLQISPPVSSKVGKLQSAGRSFSWNQKEMKTMGFNIDNPAYLASAQVISAATNVPLDRAIKKITNIKDAGDENIEYYKRVALALGWSAWELGIKKDSKGKVKKVEPKTDMDKLYDLNKKQQIDSLLSLGLSKKQIKALKLEEDRVKAILDPKSIKEIKVSKIDSLFGLNKKEQVEALTKLGYSKKEIRALRLESDRVEAIINKQKQEN